MSTKTQTAIALTGVGKPLAKITRPIPIPKETEVLLKITAAGITPLDMKLQTMGLMNIGSRLPAILGCDVVGEIAELGTSVTNLKIGQRVLSQMDLRDSTTGGLQEYTTRDAKVVYCVPKNVSDVEATAFPINAFTALIALFGPQPKGLGVPLPGSLESRSFDYKSLQLVIIGGGTNCGQLAAQFARIAGIGSIIVVGGGERAKQLGATHIIDRKLSPDEIKQAVHEVTGDELLYLIDTFTALDHSLPVSLLSNSKRGSFVHLGHGVVKDEEVVKAKNAGYNDTQIVGAPTTIPDVADAFWERFVEWVEKGEIEKPRIGVVEGLDVEMVNNAFAQLATWKVAVGKWAIKI